MADITFRPAADREKVADEADDIRNDPNFISAEKKEREKRISEFMLQKVKDWTDIDDPTSNNATLRKLSLPYRIDIIPSFWDKLEKILTSNGYTVVRGDVLFEISL